MFDSLKTPTKKTWRDLFKRFLSFYENDFEDLCLLSLDGELSLWGHHWKNSVKWLPDNVRSTLKQITCSSFPIIKRALRNLGTMPVTSCTCARSFSSMKLLKTLLLTIMTNNDLNIVAQTKCVASGPHRMQFD